MTSGKLVRVARLEDEWYEDVTQPEDLIASLRKDAQCPDVFTFWQRLPETEPKFQYKQEPDAIAAIPLQTYAHWWDKQIDGKTRNMIRRGEKKGVVVKKTEYTDEFIQGVTSIFNETPVRQGRPFWHYGKDFETIKREFSRFLFREEIYGAYVGDELIGFIMLAYAGKYAELGQIISKVAHRDKSPNNVLIAKAVEICSGKNLPHLVYAKWEDGTLGEFKRNHGFEKINLPRYYVPLTLKGRIYVSLRLYRGLAGLLPPRMLRLAKRVRRKFNEFRQQKKTKSA